MSKILQKTKYIYLSIIYFFLVKNAYGAHSDTHPPNGDSSTEVVRLENPLNVKNIPDFLAQILDLLVMVAVPIAVLFIIYSGFLFVTARGNSEKLKKARMVLLGTLVGTALILGAALIANVIAGTITQLGGNT